MLCVAPRRPVLPGRLAPVLNSLQPDHQDGLSTLGTTVAYGPARGPACGLHTGCVCMVENTGEGVAGGPSVLHSSAQRTHAASVTQKLHGIKCCAVPRPLAGALGLWTTELWLHPS